MMSHDIPKPIVRTDATPTVMRIVPELAVEIGLNESIMLLQIAHWISITDHLHDGRYWTYQSVRDMQAHAFPFWGVATINRTIKALEDAGFVVTGNYNQRKGDKTRWFSLCVEKLQELRSISIIFRASTKNKKTKEVFQNGTPSFHSGTGSDQNGTTLPETSTEITTVEEEKALSAADVFRAYEINIGTLTPKIMDTVKDWLTDVPAEWLIEALDLAVEYNKRSWAYAETILKRWKAQGKDDGKKADRPGKTTGTDLTALGDSSTWGPEQWAQYNQIMREGQS